MQEPIFGLNIPAPCIKIGKDNLETYVDLYRGIRNRNDTVSWRTLIITIRKLLGVKLPDFKKLDRRSIKRGKLFIKQLINKTYLAPLVLEIEYAVGIGVIKSKSNSDIDLLIFSARHFPEPLLWSLADWAS